VVERLSSSIFSNEAISVRPKILQLVWMNYLEVYNTHHAHPYRWTYTGQPLVRATAVQPNATATTAWAGLV